MNNEIPSFNADGGANLSKLVGSIDNAGPVASRESVNTRLSLLRNNVDAMRQEYEDRLRKLALVVVQSGDERLIAAHVSEWPQEELGALPDNIPFKHYRTLRLKTTAAARLLRRRWEEAARDVSGDIAIDPLMILDIIEQEMDLIDNYLTTKGSYVDSAAEQRVLGNFEMWIQTALVSSRRIHQRVTSTPEGGFQTAADQGATEQESVEARKSQARAKSSLNGLNDVLRQEMQVLRRDYTSTGLQFYRDTLLPTVKRRALDQDDPAVASAFRNLLDDQVRRLRSFRDKVDAVETIFDQREAARRTIRDLSYRGRALPTSGIDVMVRIESSRFSDDDYRVILEEEVLHSLGTELGSTVDLDPSDELTADHGNLKNLEEDHHPLYLKKDGGTIEGDISMKPGTKIDGMRPGTHRHTGLDGTQQIRGSDILGGTLSPDLVDQSNKPPVPENLELVTQKTDMTAPGSMRVDAEIGWDGFENFGYEVQIQRVGAPVAIPSSGPTLVGDIDGDNNTAFAFQPISNSPTFSTSGGTEPYVLSMTGEPNGVSLVDNGDGTGELSGTPFSEGEFEITITVTDDDGATDDLIFTYYVVGII